MKTNIFSWLPMYISQSCSVFIILQLFSLSFHSSTATYYPHKPDLVCTDICASHSYRSYYDHSVAECIDLCYKAMDILQLAIYDTYPVEVEDESGDIGLNMYPDIDGYNDIDQKQNLPFVRIGKQKSAFVRIGRSVDAAENELNDNNDVKRVSSFVRIGKSMGTGAPEYVDSDLMKRASSFVRIGKSNTGKYLFKRPSSFVRIGKKSLSDTQEIPTEKRLSSFVRIGKSMDPYTNEDKRKSSFVRIGKASPSALNGNGDHDQDQFEMYPKEDDEKRMSNFVRIGRPSSFVRIGKDGNDKRVSSFVRIGKKDSYDHSDMDKRVSSFVRIGKANPATLDQNEQFDTNNLEDGNNEKKRVSSFVRIGKNSDHMNYPAYPLQDDAQKRFSKFVRIGKSYADDSELSPVKDNTDIKRVSSFVRIGKNWNPSAAEKRYSNFVRIGKRSTHSDNQNDDQS